MKQSDGAALPPGLKQISPPLRKDGNIDTLIPVKEKNELRRSVWGMCRGFVTDAVNSAIETGQSQVAARSKQVAFGNRMVIQSFFTQEQLFSFFLPSPGYRSLTLCSSLRRALLMDHGCLLRQIDLLSGQQMEPMHLGQGPPMLPSHVIGMALDDSTATLGALDSAWNLSSWDMRFAGGGDGPGAHRDLTRFEEVDQARKLFNFRGYSDIAPCTVLMSCDLPVKGFLLNISFVNGILMLFECTSLGLLHRITVGGAGPSVGIGIGMPSLWERCEAVDVSFKGVVDQTYFNSLLNEMDMTKESSDKIMAQAAKPIPNQPKMMNYAAVLSELDSHRYNILTAPKCKPTCRRLPASELHTFLKSMRSSAVRDMLFELQCVENSGVITASVPDDTLVYFIDLDSGRFLGLVRHTGVKAPSKDSLHLPPILMYVEASDCLLTAGRNEWDGCINLWNLGDLSNGRLPQTPSKRYHWDAALSATCTLAYLPVSQAVVQCRVDGGVCLWDVVTAGYALAEPSRGNHDEGTGRDAKPLKDQRSTFNCSSTRPSLIIKEGSTALEAFPTVAISTARRPQGTVDMFLALSAPFPTMHRDSDGLANTNEESRVDLSGTVTGFSIVRTRAKVPAVCSDLTDLPNIVKEKVDQAAADHLRKGMQQMQAISIEQLKGLIEKDGPQRTHHTRLLNGAMRRASLDFEWSPAPLSNDAERWHLLGSGNAREDHFTVDDVDEMSTTGAGYGIWKGQDLPCQASFLVRRQGIHRRVIHRCFAARPSKYASNSSMRILQIWACLALETQHPLPVEHVVFRPICL